MAGARVDHPPALSDGTYALASGSIGSWLRRRRSIAGIQRVSAAIYAALGITALVGERP